MIRIFFMIITSVLLLVGCENNQVGLPKDVEKKMQEQLGMDIIVPVLEKYPIKYASIEYPPVVNNKPVGNRHVARIVYTNEKGPLIKLTKEQKEQIEGNNRKIFYGEYEGKPIIILEISNMKNSLADAKTQQIEGIQVEYNFKDTDFGKVAFFSFNVENGSYMTTFHLNDAFKEEDAFEFNKNLISELK